MLPKHMVRAMGIYTVLMRYRSLYESKDEYFASAGKYIGMFVYLLSCIQFPRHANTSRIPDVERYDIVASAASQ